MIRILTERKQARYIFEFIFSVLKTGFEFGAIGAEPDLVISYGREVPEIFGKHIHIHESDFWQSYEKRKMPNISIKNFSSEITALFAKSKADLIEKKGENLIIINADIIASSFFMISRYEEYFKKRGALAKLSAKLGIGDRCLRFSAKESVAYKNFLDRPIVDEYVEFLGSVIKELCPNLKIERDEFKIFSTHDIDNKLTGQYEERVRYFLENEKEIRSAYFLMSGKNKGYDDGDFDMGSPEGEKIIEMLKEKNVEIGPHFSILTCCDEREMEKEKNNFGKAAGEGRFGTRQHYLMFDVKKTWQIQDKAGIAYDTTLGFADCEGFRCGTCHPFKAYDLERDMAMDLVEYPLIVMDATLSDSAYRNLSSDMAINVIKDLKEKCRKYKGIFTILWHPDGILSENIEWENAYKESIKL